jgi:hypothetical protein
VIKQRWAQSGDDPILVAASYNAGGVYSSDDNPWRIRCYGNHLDRGAQWYGDACFVLKEAGAVPRTRSLAVRGIQGGPASKERGAMRKVRAEPSPEQPVLVDGEAPRRKSAQRPRGREAVREVTLARHTAGRKNARAVPTLSVGNDIALKGRVEMASAPRSPVATRGDARRSPRSSGS